MGLRILTGVLVPTATPGNATINFRPHGIEGDATELELNAEGEDSDFNFPPGKVVSLRQITLSPAGGTLTLNDGVPTEEFMTVNWNATAGSAIAEISYLIVGEA